MRHLNFNEIKNNFEKFQSIDDTCKKTYKLTPDIFYDAIVFSPTWCADKVINSKMFNVTKINQSWQSSYYVKSSHYSIDKNKQIAWIQCGAGAGNLMDSMIVCSNLRFKTMFFVGDAYTINSNFRIGDLCTPIECITANGNLCYLTESLAGHIGPFYKYKESVQTIQSIVNISKREQPFFTAIPTKIFCTDTNAVIYSHIDEIKETEAELISPECGTFIAMAEFFNTPSYALLTVESTPTENRITQDWRYDTCRGGVIPELIVNLCNDKINPFTQNTETIIPQSKFFKP